MNKETDSARPQFGDRKLENPNNVFKHNAWDNVDWTSEQEAEALKITKLQLEESASLEVKTDLLENASSKWDSFYKTHNNKFFKDRHWLFTEFPELLVAESSESSKTFLEVGCGAGNTIFPLLKANSNSNFFIYGCDFAQSSIDVVKNNEEYNSTKCNAFQHDITSDDIYPIEENSLDIIIMIFVLSATEFSKMKETIKKLARLLKPGGQILFRDYGRYDLAQLRFKKGRCLDENFYSRGDGTLVYFFTQEEVKDIFTSAGLQEEQNLVDRRLQVNRARQLKMYRVWIQAKYRKL